MVYRIGHRSSQTHVSIKIVSVGIVVMVGKVELDSIFPIIQTVCRRSPQTPGTNVSICLRRDVAYRRSCRRPIPDRCRYGNHPSPSHHPTRAHGIIVNHFRRSLFENHTLNKRPLNFFWEKERLRNVQFFLFISPFSN